MGLGRIWGYIVLGLVIAQCTKTTSGGRTGIGKRPSDPNLARAYDAAKDADASADQVVATSQAISTMGKNLSSLAPGPVRMAQADEVVVPLFSKLKEAVLAYSKTGASGQVAREVAAQYPGAQMYATAADAAVQKALTALREAQNSAQGVMLVGYKPVPFSTWCVTSNPAISASSRKTVAAIVAATNASSCGGVIGANLSELVLASRDSLQDLKPLTSFSPVVIKLDLSGNAIENPAPLAVMTELKSLNLNGNKISQLAFASQLKNLETLQVNRNPLLEVASIAQLPKLTHLEANGPGDIFAQDLSLLSQATLLKTLMIARQGVTSLEFVRSLKNLTNLVAPFNDIADVAPLSELQNLSYINLSDNRKIQDIRPLTNLKNLMELRISRTGVSSIDAMRSVTSLKILDVTGTPTPPVCPFPATTTPICRFNESPVALP